MSSSVRSRSPLAHGPDTDCASCRRCPSCHGGVRDRPTQYRVEHRGDTTTGWQLTYVCTECHGTGTTCLNLIGADQ